MPIIPAFRKLRQEDYMFKAILDYITSSRTSWASETISQKEKEKKNK
jgi:hypothetical protein